MRLRALVIGLLAIVVAESVFLISVRSEHRVGRGVVPTSPQLHSTGASPVEIIPFEELCAAEGFVPPPNKPVGVGRFVPLEPGHEAQVHAGPLDTHRDEVMEELDRYSDRQPLDPVTRSELHALVDHSERTIEILHLRQATGEITAASRDDLKRQELQRRHQEVEALLGADPARELATDLEQARDSADAPLPVADEGTD